MTRGKGKITGPLARQGCNAQLLDNSFSDTMYSTFPKKYKLERLSLEAASYGLCGVSLQWDSLVCLKQGPALSLVPSPHSPAS